VLLAGWFAVELFFGTRAGLAERVTSAADALWPLTVVVSCVRPGHPTAAGRPADRS
jgi:hypothetical protein